MLWYLVAVSTMVMSVSLNLGTVRASQMLFGLINRRIFRNPISLFDTTPIGRILNRVSKDIDTIDNVIPFTLSSAQGTLFSVNSRYYIFLHFCLVNSLSFHRSFYNSIFGESFRQFSFFESFFIKNIFF